MNARRIATIALSNRDYDDFDDKLHEACRWVALAAKMGADLAVLPEIMNLYAGDGPNNPRAISCKDAALADWQTACAELLECAVKHQIAVTVPLLIWEGDDILNCFHLVARTGDVLGRYVKTYPTSGEIEQGVAPAQENRLIAWEGFRVGGAICFDMSFPSVFMDQARAGADLFLCPSLTAGGDQVNYFAALHRRPVVISYPAWSRIIDVMGKDVVAGGYRHETLRFGFGVPVYVAAVNFDKAVFHFDRNQEKIESILRAYGATVKIEFDQQNMCFSLESLSDQFTVREVIQAFSLKPIGQYLCGSAQMADDERHHHQEK